MGSAFGVAVRYCGRSIPDGAVDHFISRERGGTDLPWNLVPACGQCNSFKKHHDPREWMPAFGMSDSAISAFQAIVVGAGLALSPASRPSGTARSGDSTGQE